MGILHRSRAFVLVIISAVLAAQTLIFGVTPASACEPSDVFGHGTAALWRMGGNLQRGVLKGTTLYAPSNIGLSIYDVSGDTTPTLLSSVDLDGPGTVVSVDGTRAAVGGAFAGLKIVDVTSSTEPTQVGVFKLDDTSRIEGVAVRGDWAFVSYEGHGFKSVDLSDPKNPEYRSYVGAPSGYYEYGPVVLSGDTAYVVALSPAISHGPKVANTGGDAQADGVTAIDVTDPTSMAVHGTWVAPSGAAIPALAAEGTTVLAADPGQGVHQLSFADPDNPEEASSVFTDGGTDVRDVKIDGIGNAYLVDGTAGISAFSTDSFPSYLYNAEGTWGAGAPPYRWISVDGTRSVAGDSGGFQVLDVTNPNAIGALGRHDALPQNALDAKVVGDYVYGFDAPTGLFAAHIESGTPNMTWAEDSHEATSASIDASGTRLVLGAGRKVRVFDLTDPAAPSLAGEATATATISGVALDGDTAYVTERNGDLEIFDVSGAPSKTGEWVGASADPAVPGLNGIYVHDGHAYVTAGDYTPPMSILGVANYGAPSDAVVVLDVHDPASVSEVTRIGTIGAAVSVTGDGERLFIGTNQKLQVADITDPAAAHIVGNYLYFGYPLRGVGLDAENNLVWAATQEGLYAVDVTDINNMYAAGNYGGGDGFDPLTVKMDGTTAVSAGGATGVVAVGTMAQREAGVDRYGTSVELSQKTFATSANVRPSRPAEVSRTRCAPPRWPAS